MEQPGMLQAVVNALRNKAGMGQQQAPGPATDALGAYRRYALDAQEQGQAPMSLQDWQNSMSQQMPVSSPR